MSLNTGKNIKKSTFLKLVIFLNQEINKKGVKYMLKIS